MTLCPALFLPSFPSVHVTFRSVLFPSDPFSPLLILSLIVSLPYNRRGFRRSRSLYLFVRTIIAVYTRSFAPIPISRYFTISYDTLVLLTRMTVMVLDLIAGCHAVRCCGAVLCNVLCCAACCAELQRTQLVAAAVAAAAEAAAVAAGRASPARTSTPSPRPRLFKGTICTINTITNTSGIY